MSPNSARARSPYFGVLPEVCAVTMTFGMSQSGESGGSGSGVVTSRPAPPR